ncbi:ABC transporter substrate-binding protein [Simplicispira psychrophila]|uniref:ABC transporter substrate-binding protein n=1 Tax=Simplicispira psychrophila TaxID=80882 RepID=UPI000485D6E3|nr:ABC transporter substrate-binding protein [Simplicispira psychrophila]
MLSLFSASLTRRHALGAVGVLGALAAPGMWAALPASAPGRVTLAVGARAVFAFRHLPLTIAEQLDFFAAEGLQVTLQPYASDALALQAMRDGVADVCALDFEQLLRQPETSAGTARCFVVQGRAAQVALGVSLRSLPRFKTLADVRGRKVGICALGTQSHTVACLALAQAGLTPADVTFVVVGEDAQAADALRTGRVQALCHGDPLMTQLEHQGEVRIVGDARTLSGAQALFGDSVPGGCLVAPVAFLQQRAPQAQALANAVVHALKWLQTAGPADLVKALPASSWGQKRSVYLAAFARGRETLSPDGTMPSNGPATALRALALAAPEAVLARIDAGRTFTPEFARKAKLKFSA